MFGEKAKKIVSLESDVKYWINRTNIAEGAQYESYAHHLQKLDKELKAERENVRIAAMKLDLLEQVLKQLHIPVKLK